MAARKKKRDTPKVFDLIRKPTAPPSRKHGDDRPEAKVYPAGRNVKHKKRPADGTEDGSF